MRDAPGFQAQRPSTWKTGKQMKHNIRLNVSKITIGMISFVDNWIFYPEKLDLRRFYPKTCPKRGHGFEFRLRNSIFFWFFVFFYFFSLFLFSLFFLFCFLLLPRFKKGSPLLFFLSFSVFLHIPISTSNAFNLKTQSMVTIRYVPSCHFTPFVCLF